MTRMTDDEKRAQRDLKAKARRGVCVWASAHQGTHVKPPEVLPEKYRPTWVAVQTILLGRHWRGVKNGDGPGRRTRRRALESAANARRRARSNARREAIRSTLPPGRTAYLEKIRGVR